jgi:hypothetical protein
MKLQVEMMKPSPERDEFAADIADMESMLEAYLAFAFDRPGAAQTLSGFPNDFVLINPKSVAADVMASAAQWRLIYSDSDSTLYARRDSRAAGIAGVPIRGATPAPVFP